jgi:hypothetical protein
MFLIDTHRRLCDQYHGDVRGVDFGIVILDMAMKRIFWGFGRNWFLILRYIPYSTFRAVPILALNSRRYS